MKGKRAEYWAKRSRSELVGASCSLHLLRQLNGGYGLRIAAGVVGLIAAGFPSKRRLPLTVHIAPLSRGESEPLNFGIEESFGQDHSNDNDESRDYAHRNTDLLTPREPVVMHSSYLGVFKFPRLATFLGLQREALIANRDDCPLDVRLVD